MEHKHPHARIIEKIGRREVADHFGLSYQALQNWINRGVPVRRRLPFAGIAKERGVRLPGDFLSDLGAPEDLATIAQANASSKKIHSKQEEGA